MAWLEWDGTTKVQIMKLTRLMDLYDDDVTRYATDSQRTKCCKRLAN